MTDLLDIAAVAERSGLRPASVRQHLWRGTMPTPDAHVGRSPRWHPETIEAWLTKRRGPGRPSKNPAESVDVAP